MKPIKFLFLTLVIFCTAQPTFGEDACEWALSNFVGKEVKLYPTKSGWTTLPNGNPWVFGQYFPQTGRWSIDGKWVDQETCSSQQVGDCELAPTPKIGITGKSTEKGRMCYYNVEMSLMGGKVIHTNTAIYTVPSK